TSLAVGSRKQLFIDYKFIEASDGITLRAGVPYQTREILVTTDQPWEKGLGIQSYSTVLKEDGKVRLWYSVSGIDGKQDPQEPGPPGHFRPGSGEEDGEPPFSGVAYAESNDGLHFRKPVLGLVARAGSRDNNFVLPPDPSVVKLGGGSVLRDENPNCPPAERYKSWTDFSGRRGSGLKGPHRVWYSADGLRWKLYETPATGLRSSDTQPTWFWDPRIGRYVGYAREWVRHSDVQGEGGDFGMRMASYNESDDMLHWDSAMVALAPDERDFAAAPRPVVDIAKTRVLGHDLVLGKRLVPTSPMDMYGPGVFRYTEADGVYIALTPVHHHWYTTTTATQPSTADVQLSVSRDARHFQRAPGRQPFLSVGLSSTFDSKWVWPMPNPVRMADELWIYYVGSNKDHNSDLDPAATKPITAISRAILRLDGFMSAEAAHEGGWLITPPVVFEGSRLELNLDTGAGGVARVELLDEMGKPIPGYGLMDADELNGNSIRMPVSWKGKADVGSLAGKSVRLHIRMRAARLYAFQFKP
ncbi:MAG: hypothetical protein KJZ78_09090, partial [Bryobacteraceae bacterium]|nr:hypothetical protein [Bryobacteraceae bacterium]